MSNQLISALGLAREGFQVFPLQPNGKKPLFAQNWKEIATTDEAVIKRWWRENPHANVAIRTDGWVGIDLDIRRGGDDSWRDIVAEHEFLGDEILDTRRHETWSGGSHIIFRQPQGILIGCSTDKLGPGVDVKATGGYLVAPTSRIDGKTYRIINPHQPIAELPGWLVELCRQVRARSPAAGKRLVEEDEVAIANAAAWLIAHGPDAHEGGRDDAGYKVAAKLYNFGVSRDTCREMLGDWNYGHCFPPLEPDDIERLSRSAEVNRSQPIGIEHPGAPAFDPYEIAPRPTPPANTPKAKATQGIAATPFRWVEPASIKRREWLYGRHAIRQFLSATVAAGGSGKTSEALVEAIAMAAGRDLLSDHLEQQTRAWYVGLEDPFEEYQRRVAAVGLHYGIGAELEGQFFLDSGRTQDFVIAREGRDGILVAEPIVSSIVDNIRKNDIGHMTVDPFVASHAVRESDNSSIEVVVRQWAHVADVTGAAIELVHHVRKQASGQQAEMTVDDARGARALVDKVRSCRLISSMSKDEAEKAGITDERRRYFRMTNGKANNVLPPDVGTWRRLETVSLGNGNGRPHDMIQVATQWAWPNAFEGVTTEHLEQIRTRLAEGVWRENKQAAAWGGHVVADVLGLNRSEKKDRARISEMIKTWLQNGALRVLTRQDPDSRKMVPFLLPGEDADAED